MFSQTDGADCGRNEHIVGREDGLEGPQHEEVGRVPSGARLNPAPVEQRSRGIGGLRTLRSGVLAITHKLVFERDAIFYI